MTDKEVFDAQMISGLQDKVAELEARARAAIEQMVETSGYLVDVARLLNPKDHLIESPAGIHAFNLDVVGCDLQEALAEQEPKTGGKCPTCGSTHKNRARLTVPGSLMTCDDTWHDKVEEPKTSEVFECCHDTRAELDGAGCRTGKPCFMCNEDGAEKTISMYEACNGTGKVEEKPTEADDEAAFEAALIKIDQDIAPDSPLTPEEQDIFRSGWEAKARQPTDTDVLRESVEENIKPLLLLMNSFSDDMNDNERVILGNAESWYMRIKNSKPETQEEGGDTTVRGYLLRDIKNLPSEDIHVLYRYMRRHMIADIPGLEDPLAYLRGESSRLKDSEPEEKEPTDDR